MLGGGIGVRAARTRDCFYIFSYLVLLVVALLLQYRALQLLGVGFFAQAPALPTSDVLWTAETWNNAQLYLMHYAWELFVSYFSRDHYDCHVQDGTQATCAAQLEESPMLECQQPYPGARSFQEMVNKWCTQPQNLPQCARCVENLGSLVGISSEAWNPVDPANQFF